MQELVVNGLRGIAIGLANIIPGVSGGTMALVLGIYERLIRAIKNIGPQTITALFRGKDAFVEEMKRVDALFVGGIAVGALAAVVGAAKLLAYLLNHQHDPTYGFFFGLVLISVVVPYRLIRKQSLATLLSALAAIALVVGITVGLEGEQRVDAARKKAEITAAKLAAAKTSAKQGKKAYSVPVDLRAIGLFVLAGAVAISAMILPGISGSFVLLLMGLYFDVLACINERNFVLLGAIALGCLVGLLAFTRFINFMLERFHDATMAFLMGLVIGSLYAIWPFKTFGMVAGKRVDMANALPTAFGGNELLTLGTVVAGAAIVGVFVWIEIKQGRGKAAEAE